MQIYSWMGNALEDTWRNRNFTFAYVWFLLRCTVGGHPARPSVENEQSRVGERNAHTVNLCRRLGKKHPRHPRRVRPCATLKGLCLRPPAPTSPRQASSCPSAELRIHCSQHVLASLGSSSCATPESSAPGPPFFTFYRTILSGSVVWGNPYIVSRN